MRCVRGPGDVNQPLTNFSVRNRCGTTKRSYCVQFIATHDVLPNLIKTECVVFPVHETAKKIPFEFQRSEDSTGINRMFSPQNDEFHNKYLRSIVDLGSIMDPNSEVCVDRFGHCFSPKLRPALPLRPTSSPTNALRRLPHQSTLLQSPVHDIRRALRVAVHREWEPLASGLNGLLLCPVHRVDFPGRPGSRPHAYQPQPTVGRGVAHFLLEPSQQTRGGVYGRRNLGLLACVSSSGSRGGRRFLPNPTDGD